MHPLLQGPTHLPIMHTPTQTQTQTHTSTHTHTQTNTHLPTHTPIPVRHNYTYTPTTHLHACVVEGDREVLSTHHANPIPPYGQQHVGVDGEAHDACLVNFFELLGQGNARHEGEVGHLRKCRLINVSFRDACLLTYSFCERTYQPIHLSTCFFVW